MNAIKPVMDKTAFSVISLYDTPDDKQYWLSMSPIQRIEAIELLRQINYGYDPTTTRFQRVFEIAELA